MTALERFIIARWMYSIAEPFIDDTEYDLLRTALKDVPEAQPYLNRSWSDEGCPAGLLQKYGLSYADKNIVLSADKSESMASIITKAELKEHVEMFPTEYSLTPKYDGFHAQGFYSQGLRRHVMSRGRRSDAVNFNVLGQHLPEEIPVLEDTRVFMEAVLSFAAFEELKRRTGKKLTSIRSSVSSAIAHHPDLLSCKAFMYTTNKSQTYAEMLDTLALWKFNPVEYRLTSDPLAVIPNIIKPTDYPTDGVVMRDNTSIFSDNIRAVRIGAYARQTYVSKVVDFSHSYGPHRIGLKLVIEPTETADGGMQRQIDIDNYSRVISLGLGIGSYVAFTKVSDAVERIDVEMTKQLNAR